MPEHPEDFALPWCQKILKDPSYMKIPLQNRLPPARFSSMGSNRCFAQTLNTPDSIRNYQPIYHPASSTGPKEHLVLVSVGSGLDSWDGILSGGILCLLVDNVCAIMASTEFGGREAVTVELVTRFKRKMHTPGVALCRAREEKREGRKLWIRGTVEDGMGQVFAEADALFWDPGVGVKVGKSKDRSSLERKRSGNVELKQGPNQSTSAVKAKL
jgi:thioesterase superfamily protein 4